ncbi:MAG: ABC transporter ATP-binding protein [Acidobacteriota bacterium]
MAGDPDPIVLVEGLKMAYGAREALRGVDLAVRPSEVFGLLGPNGGGKSTLFRILATLLAPTGGRATICGKDVAGDPHGVRRRISVVFQSPSLDKKLTVIENLRHQGRLYGLHGADLERRMAEMLGRVGLSGRERDRVETLSGGLKRRAEIAKSLLHGPALLLLDEPTTGLDPAVRREVWDHLMALRDERGMTILVTTHLMDEADRCDRVAILHEGQVVALGTPKALRAEVGGDIVLVRARDLARMQQRLSSELGLPAMVVDGSVRIERQDGQELLATILARYGEDVEGVSLDRPTLEDVFIHRTGRTFAIAEGQARA